MTNHKPANNQEKECEYCSEDAKYLGRKAQVIGRVCEDHVKQALGNLSEQCFATRFWPAICDLNGEMIYHAYTDAELKNLHAIAGWDTVAGQQQAKK